MNYIARTLMQRGSRASGVSNEDKLKEEEKREPIARQSPIGGKIIILHW